MLSPGDDWAASVIRSVFPVYGQTGGTTNTIGPEATVIGSMLGDLSGFVMAIGMAYMTYAWFMHMHRAAETSRLLGNNQTSMSIVRIGFAAIMMFPMPSGFSTGQAAVVQGSLWSIGMARTLYTHAVQAIGPSGKVIAAPMIPGTKSIVAGLIEAEMCRNLVNLAANQPDLIPDPLGNKLLFGTTVRYSYQMGLSLGTPTCGTIDLTVPAPGTSILGVPIDSAGIQQQVLQSVLESQIAPQVATIAKRFWLSRDTSDLGGLAAIVVSATNSYNTQLTQQAEAIRAKLQQAVQSDSVNWSGTSNSSNTKMNQLTALGWTGAGAYYLEFARLNGETLSIMANIPSITRPTFGGLGPSLALDIVPQMKSVMLFTQSIAETAETADNGAVSGGNNELFNGVQPNGDGAGILSQIARSLHLTDRVLNLFVNMIEPPNGMGTQNAYWVDPFGNLMQLGNTMITTALLTLGTAAVLGSGVGTAGLIGGSVVTGNFAAAAGAALGHVAVQFLSGPITVGCMALLIPGLTLTFILPMVPWIMWMAAVTSWLVMVCEAMIAVPLWMLAHMTVNGEGLHGHARAGYALLFNILFRPTLMLFGLFLSYFVFDAVCYLMHMTFGIAAGFVISRGWFITNLLGLVVLLALYVMVHITLALVSFRLIAILPDRVPAMIGFGMDGRIDVDTFARDAAVVGMGASLKSIETSLQTMVPKPQQGNTNQKTQNLSKATDTTLGKIT